MTCSCEVVSAARVESVQDTIWTALMLHPQLAHIGEIGAINGVGIGSGQGRTLFPGQVNPEGHIVLRAVSQPIPPLAEFIREFYLPRH